MYGQVLPYKQIQSFGLSTESLTGDFLNRNISSNRNTNVNNYFKAASLHKFPSLYKVETISIPNLGANASLGLIAASNGNLYGVPYSGTSSLKIDTTTNTATSISVPSGTGKYVGGALVDDKIYCFPESTVNNVLVIDTTTDKTYTILNNGWRNLTGSKHYCAYYASDNLVYLSPLQPNVYGVGIFDPKSQTIEFEVYPSWTWTSLFVTQYKENLYFIGSDQRWVKMNMKDRTITIINTNITGYRGFVWSKEGYLYCIPYTATDLVKFDPLTEKFYTVTSFVGGAKWFGGTMGADGNIYCYKDANNVAGALVINTTDDSTYQINYSQAGSSWKGALASNGKIYCAQLNFGINWNVLIADNHFPDMISNNFVTNRLISSNAKG